MLDSDHGRYCHYLGGADADTFMIELAQELGCFPPEIFADPASHLKAELTEVTPFPLEKTSLKKDLLKDTIERLDRHREQLCFTAAQNAVAEGRPEDLLEKETTTESLEDQSVDDRQLHAWAHFSKAYQLIETAESTNDAELFASGSEEYEKAVRLNPEFPEAYNNWGNAISNLAKIRQDEGLFRSALEKYQRAYELKPDYPDLLSNWGHALRNIAEIKQDESLFQSSLEKYQKAAELKPDSADILNGWGTALSCFATMKRDEVLLRSALEKFQRGYELNSNHAGILNHWGNALYTLAKMKQDEELFLKAFEKYQSACEIDPEHAGLFNNWGNALCSFAQLKNEEAIFESALNKYEMAHTLRPSDWNILNNWGVALSELGKLKDDKKLLHQALALLDDAAVKNPKETYNRACVHALMGSLNECRKDLENALKAGTLPSSDHMLEDEDLQYVRGETWFKTILEQNRLNAKV